MKKLLAIGLATCLPTGLAAEDPAATARSLGMVTVLVLDESLPAAKDLPCASAAIAKAGDPGCMAVHRAVLSGHMKKAPALHERGRWL
ncbi:MAG TPA: hypothetical protein VLS49_00445 [Usitatibacter sp.]|nr:hypothetical protein [Usitatibacter sp.]